MLVLPPSPTSPKSHDPDKDYSYPPHTEMILGEHMEARIPYFSAQVMSLT